MKISLKEKKKRLMYIQDEDLYYYTYIIFIILDFFKCYDEKSSFKDYRRLAYLIDFVADKSNLECMIIGRINSQSQQINQLLLRLYSKAVLKENEILKLLLALEKNGYVDINVKNNKMTEANISVFIIKRNIPSDFFNEKLFSSERENIALLCKNIKKLSILTRKTLIESLYGNEEQKWLI